MFQADPSYRVGRSILRALGSTLIAIAVALVAPTSATASTSGTLKVSGDLSGVFSFASCSQQVVGGKPLVSFTLNLSGQVQPNLYRYGLTVGYPKPGTWKVGASGATTSANLEYNYGSPGDIRTETTWYSTKGTFSYNGSHRGSMKITLSTTPSETPSVVTIKGHFTCKPLSL